MCPENLFPSQVGDWFYLEGKRIWGFWQNIIWLCLFATYKVVFTIATIHFTLPKRQGNNLSVKSVIIIAPKVSSPFCGPYVKFDSLRQRIALLAQTSFFKHKFCPRSSLFWACHAEVWGAAKTCVYMVECVRNIVVCLWDVKRFQGCGMYKGFHLLSVQYPNTTWVVRNKFFCWPPVFTEEAIWGKGCQPLLHVSILCSSFRFWVRMEPLETGRRWG